MSEPITLNTVVIRRNDLMTSELSATELVMLNIERNSYYGMEEAGKEIWNCLNEPRSVAAVVSHLLTLFAVDQETCERETLDFVNELLKNELVQVTEA